MDVEDNGIGDGPTEGSGEALATRTLQARSHPVKGVILIDSPDPFDTVPLSPEVINYVLSAIHDVSPQAQKLCKSQFMTNSQLLTKYNPHDVQLSGTIPIVFLRSKEGFNPPNVDIVPKWLSNRSCTRSLTSGWTVLSGLSIQMIDIPGNHFSAFDSHNVSQASLNFEMSADSDNALICY